MQTPSRFTLEVNPALPRRLARLAELADNLWYGWDHATRSLFARLHPALWRVVGQNPKALLARIDQDRLDAAATDPVFLHTYNHVLSAFDTYLREPASRAPSAAADVGITAYFCAEFGVHESLPTYSGGLGILAGDHCKAASDARLPFVAVGLLYRQGYFQQSIDGDGRQHAEYTDVDFADLPITPVLGDDGQPLHVALHLGQRALEVKVWRARVGHVSLYLLDTDVPQNDARDRHIAHRLYGGDRGTRLEQELVLGIGGVRALAALGITPAVWHVNEGHPAFLIVERMRLLVSGGMDPDAALEAVAANTVFTTHTPVPAGHDHFLAADVATYLAHDCVEAGLDIERVLALGASGEEGDFNMTALGVHGSRFQNGVSRIHGHVSATMLADLWPEVAAADNSLRHVTNGVHIPTFLATEWADVFDRFLGHGWLNRLDDPQTREQIAAIPDHIFWSTRQHLKSQLLRSVQRRVRSQGARNGDSESQVDRALRNADPENPNILTIGFARRFATYKRAALLLDDVEHLRAMVNSTGQPLMFIFAGKAHPADEPGQAMIRAIVQASREPDLEGRILLVEGYDIRLARHLVAGVDVWLNNPVYPLEASGTSGMKAGMNGVINLSVLDGWWGEGYDGSNGWAIKPAPERLDPVRRDHEDARTLYDLLRERVAPLYYDRASGGHSPEWIAMAKRSMATILPRFNAARMLGDYVRRAYVPGARQGRIYADADHAVAVQVAAWKARVRSAWPGVELRLVDAAPLRIDYGGTIELALEVALNGLTTGDIAVELLLTRGLREHGDGEGRHVFTPVGDPDEHGCQRYTLSLRPELCGQLDYRIRAYPAHAHLTHPFELGLMRWL